MKCQSFPGFGAVFLLVAPFALSSLHGADHATLDTFFTAQRHDASSTTTRTRTIPKLRHLD